MCDYFSKQYPVLNRDLLLTAAMFHDIGKTKELPRSRRMTTQMTDSFGHIIIGSPDGKRADRHDDGISEKLEE